MTNKKSQPPAIPQRKPIRPIERQKMRPWLLDLLKSGKTIPGFGWVNKKDKTFRISWRHAARHGWDPSVDAPLYELWAKHTGKFIDGDEPDPKRWKANFRCALNSLPDVQEERSASVRKGVNAFRVYRFLDEKKSKSHVVKPAVPVEVKSEFYTTTKTKRSLRMRNRKISYAKMASTDAEDEDDVTSDYGSYGDASPLRSESNEYNFSSSSGSDSESSQYTEQKPNIHASHELPVFDQICKSSDLNSFIHMLPKTSPHHAVDYMLPKTSPHHAVDYMCASSDLSPRPYLDDELASTTSSDLTDEEVVQMILDVQQDPVKEEPVSPYSSYTDCDEKPMITDAVIVTDESGEYIVLENCTVANEVVIRDTPNVTTQQVMGEEMLYYTSIQEL